MDGRDVILEDLSGCLLGRLPGRWAPGQAQGLWDFLPWVWVVRLWVWEEGPMEDEVEEGNARVSERVRGSPQPCPGGGAR